MFEEGGVVDAGREDHGCGLVLAGGRRHALQRLPQRGRIVLDGRDALLGEQVGEEKHHRLPVLEHVGDAGRRAAIVFQHVELVLVHPHDVDADDMGVDATRR